MVDVPRVQSPCGEFMTVGVRDHVGRPWPDGVTFDGNQLMTGLPCGVTATTGPHPSTGDSLLDNQRLLSNSLTLYFPSALDLATHFHLF